MKERVRFGKPAPPTSGAQFVTTLVCCPLARGLFHRAMVQSCTDMANVRHRTRRSDIWLGKSAEEWGVEYGVDELGVPAGEGQIAAMREASVAKLLETSESNAATDFYEACIDGYVKRDGAAALLAAGEFNEVPLMIGYTGDDGLGSDELEVGLLPSWPPCWLFLVPGFRLGARWNRLVETVKTRKKREKTGKNGGKMGEIWSKTCEHRQDPRRTRRGAQSRLGTGV